MADAKWKRTRYPGIYKRGNRYAVKYRANGTQHTESVATIDEARRLKSAREADAHRGEFHTDSRVAFHEYAVEWVERYQGRGNRGFREETRADYRSMLERYAFEFFPARARMSEITPRRIGEFVGWLAKKKNDSGKREGQPLSDSTIRNILNPVRACFATALTEGVVRQNPTSGVSLPHRPSIEDDDDQEARPLSREQLAALLVVVHPRHRLMFRFLAATGLRWSELAALQWQHLRLDGSSACVRIRRRITRGTYGPPKSKHGRREVPLSPALVDELRAWHKQTEWPGPEHLLFPSTAGTPMHYSNMRSRVLVPAAGEIDASWMGFHTLRHTYASLMLANGTNIVQLSRALGHHSAAFSLSRYTHLIPGEGAPALDLDAEIRPNADARDQTQSDPTEAPTWR